MEQGQDKKNHVDGNQRLQAPRSAYVATPSRRAEGEQPPGRLDRHAGQRGVNHCLPLHHAINVPSRSGGNAVTAKKGPENIASKQLKESTPHANSPRPQARSTQGA
jgi:hypothetical protein